jgi:hypothetical protein
VLDEQNVPAEGRWMVVPAWMVTLLLTSDLKNANLTGDATSVIRNGMIGVVDTFTIYRSNQLSTSTDGSSNTCTRILFGTNHAVTFATQITENETLKNPTGFGDLWRGLQVYGFKTVKAEAMGLLYAYKSS